MSDPKSFLAAVGRMAEAVSGRTPTLVEHLRETKAMGLNGATWVMLNVPDPLSQKAADEIERLASQLSDLEGAQEDARAALTLTLANLREAEIERLREERDEWVGIAKNEFDAALGLQKRLEQAQADAARLREALAQSDTVIWYLDDAAPWSDEMDKKTEPWRQAAIARAQPREPK